MIYTIIFGFFITAFLAIFRPTAKIEKFLVFVIGISMILFAGFREDSIDYIMYEIFYENYEEISVEPAFKFISFVVTKLTSDSKYLFLIFAIFGVTLKLVGIRILSNFLLLSVVVYLSNFFLLHEMTQIRAGVASAFLLLTIKPIADRNFRKFIIFASLGFLFHYSAIIIIPLWFISRKINVKLLFISIFIGYIAYFLGLNFVRSIPIPGIQEKIEIYLKLQELDNEQINVFNYLYLLKILIFYILLFNYKKFAEHNRFFPILLNIYCLSLVSYTVFGQIPAFATRISEFFGVVEIILIPLLVYLFKPRILGIFMVVLLAIVFLLINLFYVELILDI